MNSSLYLRSPAFVYFLILLLWAPVALAQPSIELDTMAVANKLYENGRFHEAAQTYQQLVDLGLQDNTLYYNLGNAYYQAGQPGPALLNYVRAGRLAPRAADIRANQALVRGQVAGSERPLFDWGRSWLTLNETAVIALATWLATLGLGFWRRRTVVLQWLRGATAVICLIMLFLLLGRLYMAAVRPTAVVLAEQATLTTAPGLQGNPLTDLPAGTELTVLDRRTNWVQVALPTVNQTGWLAADALGVVDLP